MHAVSYSVWGLKTLAGGRPRWLRACSSSASGSTDRGRRLSSVQIPGRRGGSQQLQRPCANTPEQDAALTRNGKADYMYMEIPPQPRQAGPWLLPSKRSLPGQGRNTRGPVRPAHLGIKIRGPPRRSTAEDTQKRGAGIAAAAAAQLRAARNAALPKEQDSEVEAGLKFPSRLSGSLHLPCGQRTNSS